MLKQHSTGMLDVSMNDILDEENSAIPCCGTDPASRKVVHSDTSVHIIHFRRRRQYQTFRNRSFAELPLLNAAA